MHGTIVKFNPVKGYGFIRCKGKGREEDVFVHISKIQGRKALTVGQEVVFDIEQTEKGPSAVDVIPGTAAVSPYLIYGLIAFPLVILFSIGMHYLTEHAVLAYFVGVNIVTFLLYGFDKGIAGSRLLRVPEGILHFLAFIGGSPAGYIGQQMFRHKTMKMSFQLVYWLILVLQVGLVVYLVW